MKAINYFPSCKYIVEKYILRTHQDNDVTIPNEKEIDNEKEINNIIANDDDTNANETTNDNNKKKLSIGEKK